VAGVFGLNHVFKPYQMKLNFPSLSAISIFICLVSIVACNKTNNSGLTIPGGNNTGYLDTTNIPFITPIGDTAGSPVSASIGANGGTLTSSDGRVQLIIPPGALSQTTNITIQPILNYCPGGLGLAYDLLPNGTKFAIPASLVFHYTDDDVNGTEPLLLASAFQDSANAWVLNDTEKDVDTVNKKISFDVNHFTVYNMFPEVVVTADPFSLRESQTSNVKVQIRVATQGKTKTYVRYYDVAASLISNWTLEYGFGTSADGTITGSGNSIVYMAPSNIDKDREVYVSCELNTPLTVKLKGNVTRTLQKLHEETAIKLLSGSFSFDVSMKVVLHQTSLFISDVYTDSATMQVDIKYKDVTISNVKNNAPSVVGGLGTYGDATVVWIPDVVGVMNIDEKNSTGTVTDDYNQIKFKLVHTNAVYPKWEIKDNHDAGHHEQGGGPVTGYPQMFVLPLKNEAQTIRNMIISPNGLDYEEITATPR
jgi:hypothetical protein